VTEYEADVNRTLSATSHTGLDTIAHQFLIDIGLGPPRLSGGEGDAPMNLNDALANPLPQSNKPNRPHLEPYSPVKRNSACQGPSEWTTSQ
jgi:hypothetical protein